MNGDGRGGRRQTDQDLRRDVGTRVCFNFFFLFFFAMFD